MASTGRFDITGYDRERTCRKGADRGIELLKRSCTDKVFLCAGGIDAEPGFTFYRDFHAEIMKIPIKPGKTMILAADLKPSYFADLREIHSLITDEKLPDQYKELIESTGIELVIARLGR